MRLQEWLKIADTAALAPIDRAKGTAAFLALWICGLFDVLSQAVSLEVSPWLAAALRFIPFFIMAGWLLFAGAFIVRYSHYDQKDGGGSMLNWGTLLSSGNQILYTSLLMILIPFLFFIFSWVGMGVFLLFCRTPLLGDFFSIAFAFIPFSFCTLWMVLTLGLSAFLFWMTPALALTAKDPLHHLQDFIYFFRTRPTLCTLLAATSFAPALFVLGALSQIDALYTCFIAPSGDAMVASVRAFFLMAPKAGLLVWPFLFFCEASARARQYLLEQEGMNK
jgi:hypothetical protein